MAQLKTGTRIYGTAAVDSTLTIGSASSTGTASQALQVTGGAYVSSNLGIGITNPGVKLDVLASASGAFGSFTTPNTANSSANISNSLGDAVLYLLNDDRVSAGLGTLANNGSVINFNGKWDSAILTSNRTFGAIGAYKENNISANQQGYLSLYTRPSSGNLVERVRIDSSGNVGIGTTNPLGLIQVGSAVTNSLFVSSNLGIGSVGIGTNFPGAKLEVNDFLGTPNRSPIVFLQRTNNLPAAQQLVENADLRIKGHISNPKLYIENQAGDPIFSIAAGVGTVGIGTSIANAPKLWVHHTNVGTYSSTTAPNTQGSVMIFNSDNTNTDLFSGISFGTRRSDNTAYAAIQGISLGNGVMGLAFKTQTAGPAYRESMRITGVGSVGVGTTTPTALLHLVSSGSGTGPGRAPVKIGAATTLATAEAGAIEYDGSVFYKTPAGSSGRGVSPATHVYRVLAAGSNFGPAASDVFPANSTLSLEPNSVYAYKIVSMLTKTTTGICTLSLLVTGGTVTNFSYATNIPAVAGSFETTGPSQVSWASSTGNTSVANIPFSNYSNNAFINHNIEGIIQTSSAAVNLRLRAVQTAGSLRINVGSYMMFTKLPSTQVGVFVA